MKEQATLLRLYIFNFRGIMSGFKITSKIPTAATNLKETN